MAKQIVIEGVEYKSLTAAAKAMVAAGKSLAEAAEATGLAYQTVYANTKGAGKVSARRAKYRVLAMGKSGKRTASEIAKKAGLTTSAVVAILKKNSIAILTKEARAAAKAAKKGAAKTPKAPRQKVTKPENLIDIPEPVIDEIPTDVAAESQAMADMADAQ